MQKINGMMFVFVWEVESWLRDPKQHSEYTTKAAHLEHNGVKLFPCRGIVQYMMQHPRRCIVLPGIETL